MSNRRYALMLSVIAALALNAVTATASYAEPTWWYLHAQLSGSLNLGPIGEGTTIYFNSANTSISCEKQTDSGTFFQATGKPGTGSLFLTLEKCTVPGQSACNVNPEKGNDIPLSINMELGYIVGSKKEAVGDLFRPAETVIRGGKEIKVFSAIVVSGLSCSIKGEWLLEGGIITKVSTVNAEIRVDELIINKKPFGTTQEITELEVEKTVIKAEPLLNGGSSGVEVHHFYLRTELAELFEVRP